MRMGLIAQKIGMSRFYDSAGTNQPVTILRVDNCKIVDIRSNEKNGYMALRLSYGKTNKSLPKTTKGFLKKSNISPFLISKEFRVDTVDNFSIGDEVGVDNFVEGQYVDVLSISIGKGFAGGMKRHNFSGNRATHGVSISHRSHGSTGQCQDPGKVFKGKKMAGRLGNKKVTIQNLLVLKIDKENNMILVRGSVPGHNGAFIKVSDSLKKKGIIKDLSKLSSVNLTASKSEKKSKNKDSTNDDSKMNDNQEEQKNQVKEETSPTPKSDNSNTVKEN